MRIMGTIRRWIDMLLGNKAREEFKITPITTDEMTALIEKCGEVYAGRPFWRDYDDIRTVNFAKSICSETSRLATLAIGVEVEGSPRAEMLNEKLQDVVAVLRHWVEYGCAYGTIIMKPCADGVQMILPSDFIITATENETITGIVFEDHAVSADGKTFYSRLEYHRIEDGRYYISNRCYAGSSENDVTKRVSIDETPWVGMMEEAESDDVDKMLFGIFRTPTANNIDVFSPLGLPLFYDCLEELKDLDVAYSRNSTEILDSRRTVLLDSDRLLVGGGKVVNTADGFERARERLRLPDYVRAVHGDGVNTMYEEINPTLNTETRLQGINALLSQIGYKCGYSNGHFVFNEKNGIATATQVEAEQQRTIQMVKDVRDAIQTCVDGLLYALDVMADINGDPTGTYEVTYDFGDITYNYEEDKARWYSYVTAGQIPFWYYLTKFEGMTEDEARKLAEMAQPEEPTLFGGEE